MRETTMFIALVAAIASGGMLLLQAQAAANLADDDGSIIMVSSPGADGYRPPSDWMHRRQDQGALMAPTRLHTLTESGVAPSLARWTPLP
jgi:hypothetical protein